MVNGRLPFYNGRKTEDLRLLFVIHVLQTHQNKFGQEKYGEAVNKMLAMIEHAKKEDQLKQHNEAKEEQKKTFNVAEFLSFLIDLQEKHKMIILDEILRMAYICEICAEADYRERIRHIEKLARMRWDYIHDQEIKEKIIRDFLAFIALEKQKIEGYIAELSKEKERLIVVIDKYNKIIDHLGQEICNRIINFLSSVEDSPDLSERDRRDLENARREIINAAIRFRDNPNNRGGNMDKAELDNLLSRVSNNREYYLQKHAHVPAGQAPLSRFRANYGQLELNNIGLLLNEAIQNKAASQLKLGQIEHKNNRMHENHARLSENERRPNYNYQDINYIISGPRNDISEVREALGLLKGNNAAFFDRYGALLEMLQKVNPNLGRNISSLHSHDINAGHHSEENELQAEQKNQERTQETHEKIQEKQDIRHESQSIDNTSKSEALLAKANDKGFFGSLASDNDDKKENKDNKEENDDSPGFSF